MPRALLFGAGSLGIPYAWVLSRAIGESNVTAVCRSNFREASRSGFTIHSKILGNDLQCKPRIAQTAADAARQIASEGENDGQPPFFDYVVVAAKALPSRPSIAELIGPAVTPGRTGIVLIQNGIGIEEEYARRYPQNPVLSTVAYFPATQVAPGVVYHSEVEMLRVGTYPAAAPAAHKDAARAFVDLIRKGGASANLHDDIQPKRWSKLLVNASWNPVCAVTRLRDREFIDSKKPDEKNEEDALGFIRDVMLEIAAVARACGYSGIDEELVDFQISRARVRDLPGIQPSMLADALESRSMEVDAIVGNTVRLAKEKGVPVPMLRTIYLLANGLSESFSRNKTTN
ncbi:6-phosphogluconate dehydrogenase C-terminal domain-like protein [Hypoxylon sp. FL1150]|nr:6-phosphogluconate dehydrogenase C-terminal domain-like protein [Hypoxylon sp. FL1150]